MLTKSLVLISLLILSEACQTIQQKSDKKNQISLENSKWVNNKVDCDIFHFKTSGNAVLFFCENYNDTIVCTYKLIAKDTLLVEELKGKWESLYGVDSIPVENHGQNYFYIKEDTLIPTYYKWFHPKLKRFIIDTFSQKRPLEAYWYRE